MDVSSLKSAKRKTPLIEARRARRSSGVAIFVLRWTDETASH
jgi:hypothetical protein